MGEVTEESRVRVLNLVDILMRTILSKILFERGGGSTDPRVKSQLQERISPRYGSGEVPCMSQGVIWATPRFPQIFSLITALWPSASSMNLSVEESRGNPGVANITPLHGTYRI